MKNLQEATERICELKGSVLALDALATSLIASMPVAQRQALAALLERHGEMARTVLLNAPISEHTISAYEHEMRRYASLLQPPG